VSEFVEECRREWRRLGVPDPIANEMAADLTADIDVAEAEGGSAEDVLGNSVFDPRRFAASWAGARGVTAPVLAPLPAAPDRSPLRRSVPAIALAAVAVIFALVAIALLIGRRSASAAVSVRGILEGPGPAHLFGPGPVGPAFRTFRVGPFFGGPNGWPFALLAVLPPSTGLAGPPGLAPPRTRRARLGSPGARGFREDRADDGAAWCQPSLRCDLADQVTRTTLAVGVPLRDTER
jgi:hypothetical protein